MSLMHPRPCRCDADLQEPEASATVRTKPVADASGTRAPAPTLRGNFVLTFFGNIIYAACQWGMLSVLAKLGDERMVGRFGLALSTAAPVFLFAGLNTRALLASDARREFTFADYLGLRLIMVQVGFLILVPMSLVQGPDTTQVTILLLIGAAKAVESISDIFYGALQNQERMRPIALSMILKGVGSLLALAVGVYLGGLIVGVLALLVVWTLLLITYDVPQVTLLFGQVPRPRWSGKSLTHLFLTALPLGIVLFLISLSVSIPRFFIVELAADADLGFRQVGVFVALSYLMVVGTTVVNALGQAATPRLAGLYRKGDRSGFVRLQSQLVGVGILLGLGGVAVAWIGGGWLLTLLYRPEYAEAAPLFLILMVAAGLGYVGSLLGYGMTAVRVLRAQTPLFALVCAITALGCRLWVPSYGAMGAAYALVMAAVIQLLGSAALLLFGLRRREAES